MFKSGGNGQCQARELLITVPPSDHGRKSSQKPSSRLLAPSGSKNGSHVLSGPSPLLETNGFVATVEQNSGSVSKERGDNDF